jgi:hypothetical protein
VGKSYDLPGMGNYLAFLAARAKWAGKGNGGVCGWVSLVVGAILAALLLYFPQWTHQHISDTMNVILVSLFPLLAGASVFLVRWVYSSYAIFRIENSEVLSLGERLNPRITVSCDDEQCILPPRESGPSMFRVIAHLGGATLVTDVMATVKAIRKDGDKLPVREPVKLRFHSSGPSGELETMRPETSVPLDMFKLNSAGKLSLAVAWNYEAFDRFCCNEPGLYEIDVSISSSITPKEFTYVCQWTGDFNTTKPYIKQPLLAPSMATSLRSPAS